MTAVSSLLFLLQANIYQYAAPIIFGLGIIGNIFIIIMFIHRRQNSCAIYLLMAAVVNTINTTFNFTTAIYTLNHSDPGDSILVFCKLRYYFIHVWGQLARYFAIFACIDRYAVATTNTRLRWIARPSVAWKMIIAMIIIWHILASHLLIFITINNGRCGQFGLYYIVLEIYYLIFVCVIPPVSMMVCGFLAYRNLRRLHGRIKPVSIITHSKPGKNKIHRRDRDLLIMVLAEVVFYVMTMSGYPFIVLETAVTNYMGIAKSIDHIAIETFFTIVAILLLYLNYSAPFYIYIVASKTFRKDFKALLIRQWH
ncbi:unnamed protein product [Adineta steineri]|uniref:G-protein coupled receptors family 1 profile domain-containing protein n=1 Tax=Adineta steineri TaxID=433720 RepID=A0A814WNV2_9BILA|nr:unnamed protein product [Adineta steineri]CAF3915269.1 unnamed protein product [Adineta steineri]